MPASCRFLPCCGGQSRRVTRPCVSPADGQQKRLDADDNEEQKRLDADDSGKSTGTSAADAMHDGYLELVRRARGTASKLEFLSQKNGLDIHGITEEETDLLFKLFDRDESGAIEPEELEEEMVAMDTGFAEALAESFQDRKADADGDGHITLEEFHAAMRSANKYANNGVSLGEIQDAPHWAVELVRNREHLSGLANVGHARAEALIVMNGDHVMSIASVIRQTGWTRKMVHEAVLHRAAGRDAQDMQVAAGIRSLLKDGSFVRFNPEGRAEMVDLEKAGVKEDSVLGINERIARQNLDFPDSELPGVEVEIRGEPKIDHDGNIFASKGNLKGNIANTTGDFDLAYDSDEEDGEIDVLKLPRLDPSNPAHLAAYGFALVKKSEIVKVETPIQFAPVIPVTYGSRYKARGGMFVETHGTIGPAHFWIPQERKCKGFIVVGKELAPREPADNGGMRLKLKLAAVEIPYDSGLWMRHDAWHSDATLRGGVFAVSFAYASGHTGECNDLMVCLQPLVCPRGRVGFK